MNFQYDEEAGLDVGMKLEAEDTDNRIICCATILQIKKDKIKLHFVGAEV